VLLLLLRLCNRGSYLQDHHDRDNGYTLRSIVGSEGRYSLSLSFRLLRLRPSRIPSLSRRCGCQRATRHGAHNGRFAENKRRRSWRRWSETRRMRRCAVPWRLMARRRGVESGVKEPFHRDTIPRKPVWRPAANDDPVVNIVRSARKPGEAGPRLPVCARDDCSDNSVCARRSAPISE
jgi:hypothetical protein